MAIFRGQHIGMAVRDMHAADSFEAFVHPDQTPVLTMELILPHATGWDYPKCFVDGARI